MLSNEESKKFQGVGRGMGLELCRKDSPFEYVDYIL